MDQRGASSLKKRPAGTVPAIPSKRLYLSIIADYDLNRSICELVDNVLDLWSTRSLTGVRIDIDRLIDLYTEISSMHDITVVEGAGGLMVPLLPSFTYADLARVLKLPVIVVAANRLGTINHLLLTVEHASCKGLRVLGYVLNHTDHEPSLAAETNREALSTLTATPCIAELPYMERAEPQGQFSLFENLPDLRLLDSLFNG